MYTTLRPLAVLIEIDDVEYAAVAYSESGLTLAPFTADTAYAQYGRRQRLSATLHLLGGGQSEAYAVEVRLVRRAAGLVEVAFAALPPRARARLRQANF